MSKKERKLTIKHFYNKQLKRLEDTSRPSWPGWPLYIRITFKSRSTQFPSLCDEFIHRYDFDPDGKIAEHVIDNDKRLLILLRQFLERTNNNIEATDFATEESRELVSDLMEIVQYSFIAEVNYYLEKMGYENVPFVLLNVVYDPVHYISPIKLLSLIGEIRGTFFSEVDGTIKTKVGCLLLLNEFYLSRKLILNRIDYLTKSPEFDQFKRFVESRTELTVNLAINRRLMSNPLTVEVPSIREIEKEFSRFHDGHNHLYDLL